MGLVGFVGIWEPAGGGSIWVFRGDVRLIGDEGYLVTVVIDIIIVVKITGKTSYCFYIL